MRACTTGLLNPVSVMSFLRKPPCQLKETGPLSSHEATGRARGPRWSRQLESPLYGRLVDSKARGSQAHGVLVLALVGGRCRVILSDLADGLPTSPQRPARFVLLVSAAGTTSVAPLRWGAAAAAGTGQDRPLSVASAPLPHPSLQGVRSFVYSKLSYVLLLIEHSSCSIIFRFSFPFSLWCESNTHLRKHECDIHLRK